jgi:hypothetical protein
MNATETRPARLTARQARAIKQAARITSEHGGDKPESFSVKAKAPFWAELEDLGLVRFGRKYAVDKASTATLTAAGRKAAETL